MIHTARQSPKFMRFVRHIRPHLGDTPIIDADAVATAILERLWHATIAGAMRGDIGRFDDEVIAEMCGWLGDAKELVTILIDCGWLDVCDSYRLVVHDWCEHAPRHVKGNVAKQGGFLKPQSVAKEPPQGHALQEQTDAKEGPPNLTKHNLTKPNEGEGQKQAALDGSKDPPHRSSDDEAAKTVKALKKQQEVLDRWNESMKQDCIMTPKRRKTMNARLKEKWWCDHWEQALRKVAASSFCCGRNDRDWLANFEWFIRPDSVANLIEGKYDDQPKNGKQSKAMARSLPPILGPGGVPVQ